MGLIWDSKIRGEESLGLKFSTRQASGILKLRQEKEIQIDFFFLQIASKSTFQIQRTKEGFEVGNSAGMKRSPILKKGIILPLALKNNQI